MICGKCQKHELRSPNEIKDGYCVFCWMRKNADKTDHLYAHIDLMERMSDEKLKRRKM